MIVNIKDYKLANGKTLSERLEDEYPDGTWQKNGDEIEFIYWVSGLKRVYRWGIKDGKTITLSASSSRITPELNPNQLKYMKRRVEIQDEGLAIFDRFNNLFAQGHSEEECAAMIAEEFGVDLNTVHETVIWVPEILDS